MRRNLILFFTLVVALAAAVGCSDDSDDNNNVIKFDTGGNNGEMEMGVDTGVDMDDGEEDMAPEDVGPEEMGSDMTIDNPGFLHGEWELQKPDGSAVATITFVHEEGAASATGTFDMPEHSATGDLNATSWTSETLATNWTTRISGTEFQFGFNMGTKSDDNTLEGTYTDGFAGETHENSKLIRQQ